MAKLTTRKASRDNGSRLRVAREGVNVTTSILPFSRCRMVDARTREQKLLFVLAANIVARRRPLETAAIVNVAKLVQCGVALELEDEWDSEGEDGDLKARICKTIWMLKELYDSELLSTETDQRRLAFSAFSSILQEHDPFVWRECLLSYTGEWAWSSKYINLSDYMYVFSCEKS